MCVYMSNKRRCVLDLHLSYFSNFKSRLPFHQTTGRLNEIFNSHSHNYINKENVLKLENAKVELDLLSHKLFNYN